MKKRQAWGGGEGHSPAAGLQVLFPSNCVSVLSGPLTWAAFSALPSPTPIPSLVWACFLRRGPLTALSVLGLNCVQRWGRGEGTDCGPCVSVCACACVCVLTLVLVLVCGRGGPGVCWCHSKASDNKERFLFSVETKPSLPEADCCPLLLSFSLRTVPLSSSPSVSFSLFSFCIILFFSPFFPSSNHLFHFFTCFSFIFLPLTVTLPSPVPLSFSLFSLSSPPPLPKHSQPVEFGVATPLIFTRAGRHVDASFLDPVFFFFFF